VFGSTTLMRQSSFQSCIEWIRVDAAAFALNKSVIWRSRSPSFLGVESTFIEERSLGLIDLNRRISNTGVLRFLKKRLASLVVFEFGGAVRKRVCRFGRFISGMSSTISASVSSVRRRFTVVRLEAEDRSLTVQSGLNSLLLIVTF